MKKSELNPYLSALENILSTIYLPVNRQISTELKHLEKGQLALRGKVNYPNYSNTVDVIFKRTKKDRMAYEAVGYRFSMTLEGKTTVTEKNLEAEVKDVLYFMTDDLIKTETYIKRFEEEQS